MQSFLKIILVMIALFSFQNVHTQPQETFAEIQKLLNETDGMFRNKTFGGSSWYMKNQRFSKDKVEVFSTIKGETCYYSYTNIDWKSLFAFEFDGQDNKNLLAADLFFKKKNSIQYFCDDQLDRETQWEKMTVYVRKKDQKKMEKYLNLLMGKVRS